MMPSDNDQADLLRQILTTVQSTEQNHRRLSAAVESLQGQVNVIAGIQQVRDVVGRPAPEHNKVPIKGPKSLNNQADESANIHEPAPLDTSSSRKPNDVLSDGELISRRKPSTSAISRIILTTYPNQSGIDPLVMEWGHKDPLQRGPVVVSRSQSTIRRRNGTYLSLSAVAPLNHLIQQLGHMEALIQFTML